MEGVEQNQSTISFSPFDGQDIVAELVERSFSSRNISEQKQIARMSRPIPKLTLKTNDRSFQESWYSNKDWLCGSVRKNRLFCWPCLLFHSSPRKSPWASTGYHNMHSFSGDSIKHEKTKSHMEAYKQWRLFDSRESVDVLFSRARREAVERHNEEVRQNREMLKNIGEAVLYLAKQELAFRGHDESRASLNQGNYRELLKCFGKLDSVFDRRLQGRLQGTERVDEGGVFTGVSADVQNDLIECIDSVIQDEIDDEMKECQFFSIQVDETTDVTAKAQLSAIIRLDKGSEIVERFLKFRNVSTDRSAQGISDIVKGILERYGEAVIPKLVMQTYDGASVMSGHLNGLQAILRQVYPYAYFFHCAAHRLNLVLCQSALKIKEVKIFFANVSAFSTFTNSSPERKSHLKSHGVDIPAPGETRWYFKSRAVSAIFNNYDTLVKAFTEISENPWKWTDETSTRTDGLLHYLESFLFCFLLLLYYQILERSAILYDILQNRSTDYAFGMRKIEEFGNFLISLRNETAFEICYSATESKTGPPSRKSEININFKQLYYEVIDCVTNMLKERFTDAESFSFLDLVNPKLFVQWKTAIPNEKIQQLSAKYGPLFNIPRLRSQLFFVYQDKDFLKDNSMELLKYIYHIGIHQCIPEFVKLLKLNAVIAISSASAERSFSCLNRVKTFLRNSMGDERLGSLCRISIHKDILKAKDDQKQLHPAILDKFIKKPRRLNFSYK